MPDYKMLYYKLFSEVADEIERLKKIQCKLEEMVMDSDDNEDEGKYERGC